MSREVRKWEIPAVEPVFDESDDTGRAFFCKLKARCMMKTALSISDAQARIQTAVRKE
jgi:hypothetical protein